MSCVSAKLVGVTQPVKDFPTQTAEGLVAHCARVSSPRDYDKRGDDAEGLLKYCIRNKHWSIFEMANAIVEVKAPRDISRQLLRHRSFHFQEFSQRYSDDIEFCDRELRGQDKTNRQNSIRLGAGENDQELGVMFSYDTERHADDSEYLYKRWLEAGAAKECARVVLPEGLTMSTLYVNGTLRSWLHYLEVRDDEGVTQWEHVQLAREIRKCLEPAFPTILGMTNET